MINNTNVLVSAGLAAEFATRGLTVSVKPNTVLAEAVRFTNSGIVRPEIMSDEGAVEMHAAYLQSITAGSMDVPSNHDKFFDSVVDDISKSVIQHIGFTKNVVKPAIFDLVEKVTKVLETTVIPAASDAFTIKVCDVPDVISDISFQDSIKNYLDKSPLEPEIPVDFGVKTLEEILTLLMTGDQATDEMIAEWAIKLEDNTLVRIWETFFTTSSGDTSLKYGFNLTNNADVFSKLDTGLCVYLLGRKLFDDVSNVGNMTLATYREALAQLRDYGGCLIQSALFRIKSFTLTDQLVIDFGADGTNCKVYGDVYRSWLATGGCPEILFGIMSSGKLINFKSAINENRDSLLRNWNAYVVYHNTDVDNKKFNSFKNILIVAFSDCMRNLSKEEQEFAAANPEFTKVVENALNAVIDGLVTADMNDIYNTALLLICRARFYYTDAEKILSDIQAVCKQNPNVNVREAALIASINYVADYMAAQMTLAP